MAIGTTNAITKDKLIREIENGGAAAHNAIYRGKNLGTSVTAAQYAAIADGSFADLYIGDYWTISGFNWRIAAFDYYLNCGDANTTAHHAVIVPDTILYSAAMNDTNTTAGGYKGSKMYTSGLNSAKTTINAAFPGHVLSHRILVVNAVTNDVPSGIESVDSTVDLMTERMVYGNPIFSPMRTESMGTWLINYTAEKSQLPLFAMSPSAVAIRQMYWLRDVVSATNFAIVAADGSANARSASVSVGVRPAFCIC